MTGTLPTAQGLPLRLAWAEQWDGPLVRGERSSPAAPVQTLVRARRHLGSKNRSRRPRRTLWVSF